jgi:hypothetical protein|eukprot:3234978-Prymnesium_polylepis.1
MDDLRRIRAQLAISAINVETKFAVRAENARVSLSTRRIEPPEAVIRLLAFPCARLVQIAEAQHGRVGPVARERAVKYSVWAIDPAW